MTEIASDVFAYGLAAGLSGTAFLATVMVLATDRGAANAVALLGGFALTLAAAVASAALLADLLTEAGGQQRILPIVKLALGLFLLSMAWRVRPWQADSPDVGAKVSGMSAKLQQLEPAMAVRVGVSFAVLPKRLIITLLAGAAIGGSGASLGQSLALTLLYLLTATGLIWITIVAYLVGGQRVADGLETSKQWLIANAAGVAFVVALLFGVLFTGQAIVELAG